MIINLNEIYPYDKFITAAKELEYKYPNLIRYVTIGKSHDNRDIILLKLGVGRQHMICCGGVHARENINPVVILKLIEYYADLYSNSKHQKISLKSKLKYTTKHWKKEYEQMLFGTCIYELLQTFTILFVPLLNPDGYMISLEGFDTIQDVHLREKCLSMNIPSAEWKYNARGVDINRNFPSVLWKPKTEEDESASENETKVLISIFNKYKSSGFLDFHSRGKQIYYYRSIMPDNYNEKQLKIAYRLQKITNYELVPPENEIDNGDSGGNTVHYYSENFLRPALTIETVEEPAEFPLALEYRESTFEELKLVIFEFGSMII